MPFQLLDPSKEGKQTVISFFLVDPEIQPVVSTAIVAPQQEDWIREAVDDSIDLRLPIEIVEKIMGEVDGLMTKDEAEKYRKRMVEEREAFWKLNDNFHFCIPFDVWNGPDIVL